MVRLRKAHDAALKAQNDKPMERFLDSMRVILDAAHKLTVNGLILFTVLAGIVSIYSVWDMLRFNRARRAEWIQVQKKLESDELSAARVAYVKGEGTEEQIALVEEANREAARMGTKLPPLLPPPEQRTHFEEKVQPVLFPREASSDGKGILGMVSGFFGGSASSSSSNDEADNRIEPDVTTEAMAQTVEAEAESAWETEKERQRSGGSLDRLGLDVGASPGTRRWWPW